MQALEASMQDVSSADARTWLARIEDAQKARPNDAHLQYLAGMVYLRHQLWGKAAALSWRCSASSASADQARRCSLTSGRPLTA